MTKVLVVEDTPLNMELIMEILQGEDFNPDCAEDGEKALKMIEKQVYDLVLMDINLPDIDGYTLTNQLKQMDEFNKIPIIALTANVMKGDREKSLEAGCDGYIQKPIDVDDLPNQIAHYLQR